MHWADLFVAKMTKPKLTTDTMHWVNGLKNRNSISKQDEVKPRNNMVGIQIRLPTSQPWVKKEKAIADQCKFK